MIDVHEALERRNAGRAHASRMILTVHDELLFEAPEEDAEEVAALAADRMARAFALEVPLTVDVGIGLDWHAAKP
jgi:DNA polymerase-1